MPTKSSIMMNVEEYYAKSIVNKSYVSTFAWTEYTLNPYIGCWHDCVYCDGKTEKYQTHEDFGSTIKVKKNAAALLERFLQNKGYFIAKPQPGKLFDDTPFFRRKKADFILFFASGVCDPYQPVEGKAKTTQQLLQVAYDYGIPVHLLTKNPLVLRDLDLLKKINEQNYAGVHFTITVASDATRKIIEPRTSSANTRFDTVKKLRREGIPSGIYFMPVMPLVGDTDENMNAIYSKAKAADASFVYAMGLTLKPGRNKNEYFTTIQEHFPELLSKYETLYSNNNKYGVINTRAMLEFGVPRAEVKTFKYAQKYGIPYTVPRYIPKGRIKSNLQIAEVLAKVAHLKDIIFNAFNEAGALSKAAYFFETYPKDIFTLQKEEIKALPISKIAFPYLVDFFMNGKSTLLDDLEHEASEAVDVLLEQY